MTKLFITVKRPEETQTIRVEGLPNGEVVNLIRGTLGFALEGKNPIGVSVSSTSKELLMEQQYMPAPEPVPSEQASKPIVKKVAEEKPAGIPKTLPLLGSENRSTFPIGETIWGELPFTKLTPEGQTLFRVQVDCPCGASLHNRYGRSTNDYIKCFECKGKLVMEPIEGPTQVIEGIEVPVANEEGYYFTASSWYEEE